MKKMRFRAWTKMESNKKQKNATTMMIYEAI